MPRYWRDPYTLDVIKSSHDAPADPGDVVVIPYGRWSRLVALHMIVAQLSRAEFEIIEEAEEIIKGAEEDNDVR